MSRDILIIDDPDVLDRVFAAREALYAVSSDIETYCNAGDYKSAVKLMQREAELQRDLGEFCCNRFYRKQTSCFPDGTELCVLKHQDLKRRGKKSTSTSRTRKTAPVSLSDAIVGLQTNIVRYAYYLLLLALLPTLRE